MASLISIRPSMDAPKNYFRIIKLGLKVAGVNLDGNESILYRIYSVFVIIFISLLYLILDFLEIFKHDFSVAVESILLFLFPFTLATVKAIVIMLKRKKFGYILKKLEQEPFTPNSNRGGDIEDELVRECVWLCNMQTRAYWCMASFAIISMYANVFFKRLGSTDYHDWIFAAGPLTVLNVTYSPNYEISVIYQCIVAIYFALQFGCVDMVTVSALAHISYQFKIVQANIRRITYISYDKMQKENISSGSVNCSSQANSENEIYVSAIPWKYLKSSLKEAVEYHLVVINLVQEMESVYSGLLLVIFLSNLGIICFSVYHTTLLSIDDPTILSLIVDVVVMCFQIALICYWGEQVLFESQEVGRAAYESNFVGTDIRFQKALVLIIRRSQNPSQLTAGNFTAACMATFVWVMRASYSAFMLISKTK